MQNSPQFHQHLQEFQRILEQPYWTVGLSYVLNIHAKLFPFDVPQSLPIRYSSTWRYPSLSHSFCFLLLLIHPCDHCHSHDARSPEAIAMRREPVSSDIYPLKIHLSLILEDHVILMIYSTSGCIIGASGISEAQESVVRSAIAAEAKHQHLLSTQPWWRMVHDPNAARPLYEQAQEWNRRVATDCAIHRAVFYSPRELDDQSCIVRLSLMSEHWSSNFKSLEPPIPACS